ncbi:MAG: energy transducer TonB [Bacteroidales bacterium]
MKLKVTAEKKVKIIFIILLIQVNFSSAQEFTRPVCYGGQRLFREFIQQEMIYPEEALLTKKEGTVELSFFVKPDGSTEGIEVTQSVSPEIDAEAVRLFRHILWHPAKEMGKPVGYMHSIQIRFKKKTYLRHQKNRNDQFSKFPHEPVDESFTIYDLGKTDRWPVPVFSAIDRNLNNFLNKNLVYPDAAYKQNISGTVKLRFVVETTGRISNIEVVEPVGGGCTEEAIRVAQLINWYPGLKNNQAVRTFLPFEITFDIAGGKMGGVIPTPGQVQ